MWRRLYKFVLYPNRFVSYRRLFHVVAISVSSTFGFIQHLWKTRGQQVDYVVTEQHLVFCYTE